jgi:hypothetical protein
MASKQFEVQCPCCSSRILLDVRTGKVLRALRPEELDSAGKPKVSEKDWEDAFGRVRDRRDSGESRLDQALAREKDKSSRLDDLFREAADKAREDEEPPG